MSRILTISLRIVRITTVFNVHASVKNGAKFECRAVDDVFGIGRMLACFHWGGTIEFAMETLNRPASGLSKKEAPIQVLSSILDCVFRD